MWGWVCRGKNIDNKLIICGINVEFQLNFFNIFSVLVKGTSTELPASQFDGAQATAMPCGRFVLYSPLFSNFSKSMRAHSCS